MMFIKQILRIGWLNNKKYDNECKKTDRLTLNARERGVNIYTKHKRKGKSKWTEYRRIKQINKTMKSHGDSLRVSEQSMQNKWISYQHKKDTKLFDDNRNIARHKQQQFNDLQKKLWTEYRNNPQRITDIFFTMVNRKQSLRDAQELRVSVS